MSSATDNLLTTSPDEIWLTEVVVPRLSQGTDYYWTDCAIQAARQILESAEARPRTWEEFCGDAQRWLASFSGEESVMVRQRASLLIHAIEWSCRGLRPHSPGQLLHEWITRKGLTLNEAASLLRMSLMRLQSLMHSEELFPLHQIHEWVAALDLTAEDRLAMMTAVTTTPTRSQVANG